jgi:hypothetical protein
MEHDEFASTTDVTYDANLPSYQLILEIRRLLNLHRRSERALCRYMADLAERIRDQRDVTLARYSDEFHAARESEVDTGAGVVTLDRAGAATFGCGVTQIDLASEGRSVSRSGPLPSAVRRAVLLRDRCRCRVPGCNRRRYVDVHHIQEQARGGEHSRSNCLVLCTTHHRLLHEGKLTILGDAEGELAFLDAEGAAIARPAATQGGSPLPAAADAAVVSFAVPAATQGRSAFSEAASEVTTRLLRTIGSRGGWTIDKLIEHSGLTAKDVSAALTFLELDGRIRHGAFGFEPA